LLGQPKAGRRPPPPPPRRAQGAGSPPAKLEPPFPLHEEYVEVNGVRLHCVSPGRRNRGKPLMLFVHGFPELWFS
jgi:hypothetical protein